MQSAQRLLGRAIAAATSVVKEITWW